MTGKLYHSGIRQAGYNYRYFQDFIHAFNLGGPHPFLCDQITFTGLNEFGIQNLNKLPSGQLLLGAGLSFGYLSLIGPVKVSFTYSPQTGNVLADLNLGWSL